MKHSGAGPCQDIKELMPDVNKTFHHFTGRSKRQPEGRRSFLVAGGSWLLDMYVLELLKDAAFLGGHFLVGGAGLQ